MGKSGSTLVAILAGAAVGAVAGILLAPEQGEKTRKKIGKGFKSGSDDISSKFEDLKNQVKSLVNSKKGDLESTINSFVDKAGDKSEDVINALEKKLSELKKDAANTADTIKSQVK